MARQGRSRDGAVCLVRSGRDLLATREASRDDRSFPSAPESAKICVARLFSALPMRRLRLKSEIPQTVSKPPSFTARASPSAFHQTESACESC